MLLDYFADTIRDTPDTRKIKSRHHLSSILEFFPSPSLLLLLGRAFFLRDCPSGSELDHQEWKNIPMGSEDSLGDLVFSLMGAEQLLIGPDHLY